MIENNVLMLLFGCFVSLFVVAAVSLIKKYKKQKNKLEEDKKISNDYYRLISTDNLRNSGIKNIRVLKIDLNGQLAYLLRIEDSNGSINYVVVKK